MLTEIACGPISESAVLEEIPFVCSLFVEIRAAAGIVQYGWACNAEIDALWQPEEITTSELPVWIDRSITEGIYQPGRADVFIEARGLKIQLCHEADIHVETEEAAIIRSCASHWLAKEYRLLRSDAVPPKHDSWRQVQSVEDAAAGL
jgi:hypothetical protein